MSEERKALYDDIGKAIRNAKPGELDHELAIIAAYRAGVAVGTDLASAAKGTERKEEPEKTAS